MTGRTLRLPALVAAAALVACAIALLAMSQKAEAAFPGQIAFSTSGVTGGSVYNSDIFAMNADGTGLRNITNSRADEYKPAWSPDGKRLVYQRGAPHRDPEIGIVQAVSGSKKAITDNDYRDLDPSFSSDGEEVVFVNQRFPAAVQDVYVMNRDGSGLRRLTAGPARDIAPVFSPDGAKIAFGRIEGDGSERIWTMDSDGTNQRVLVAAPPGGGRTPDSNAEWSPDGTEIAFRRYPAGGYADIYAVRPDGTGLRNITNTPNVTEGYPSYSPDGSRIAFLRYDSPNDQNDIWTMDTDGSDQVQVTDTPNVGAPKWQPIP